MIARGAELVELLLEREEQWVRRNCDAAVLDAAVMLRLMLGHGYATPETCAEMVKHWGLNSALLGPARRFILREAGRLALIGATLFGARAGRPGPRSGSHSVH